MLNQRTERAKELGLDSESRTMKEPSERPKFVSVRRRKRSASCLERGVQKC